jgi:hypothetical protein
MIKKSDLTDFKRGGATHTRVAPFKMAWLILDIESCGRTDQIDMASDVHVEVSRAKWTDVTSRSHVGRTDVTQKDQI